MNASPSVGTPVVDIPPRVAEFAIYRVGQKGALGAMDKNGLERKRFPIELLSIELVRATWGPGEYSLSWYDKDGGTRGRAGAFRIFDLPADPVAVAPPAPVAAAPSPAYVPQPLPSSVDPLSPLGQMMAQQSVMLQMRAAESRLQAEQNASMFSGMRDIVGMVMGANMQQNQSRDMQQLLAVLQQQNQAIVAMQAQIADLLADDGDGAPEGGDGAAVENFRGSDSH